MSEHVLPVETPSHRLRLARPREKVDSIAYLFVAFFTVPFVLFNVLPVLFGLYLAFTNWSIVGTPTFVGFGNFVRAYKDRSLWQAFGNTIRYAIVIVPSVVVLAYAAALYVNQRWPLAGLARTLFFAPNVVAATVVGLVWVAVLDARTGPVNEVVALFGGGGIPWLTSTQWAWVGVSAASVWWDLGLAFVLFLAALQDVSSDLVDAARMDGARWMQRVWYVLLPATWNTIAMVIMLQLISTFRIFSQVYLMTAGGPAGSTMSVIQHVYNSAMVRNLMGYASAVSMLLFVCILAVAWVQSRLLGRRA
ncbi:carbohydrate ABC transporter permease [Lichenifustis flavocetrariae]|uniref:Sugar ABC transporter permease n=1 Tax=Lichenifustis flavocetrariae TaxID=2949735 RepID=A0AA41YXQ5_9HYPH|nr:sugar ABC transporter permease [Lichenifustis flavocetrariae]MCW6509240.1 sugar ABC transporter permease [Lichenifustis flavocetrariae]